MFPDVESDWLMNTLSQVLLVNSSFEFKLKLLSFFEGLSHSTEQLYKIL